MVIKQITFPSLRHRTTFPGINWDFFPFFYVFVFDPWPFFHQHSQLFNEDHTTCLKKYKPSFIFFWLLGWNRRRKRNFISRDCGHGAFHEPGSWTPIVDITFFSFLFFFFRKFNTGWNCNQNPRDVYELNLTLLLCVPQFNHLSKKLEKRKG